VEEKKREKFGCKTQATKKTPFPRINPPETPKPKPKGKKGESGSITGGGSRNPLDAEWKAKTLDAHIKDAGSVVVEKSPTGTGRIKAETSKTWEKMTKEPYEP